MMDDAATATPPPAPLPEVQLAGVRLHAITEAQCVAHVMASLAAGGGGWIATANLDHMRRLRQSAEFRALYANATVVTADGMPVVWACRLQGTPIPARVAGSDMIKSLPAAAAQHGRSIFLLGGSPGTADSAVASLRAANPTLRVAGTLCPPLGFEQDAAQMAAIERALAAAQPDLVFVALGSPKQEVVIDRLRALLLRAWWIGVGISFSFVAGDVQRAPRWMQKLGLEWLHRLVQEPRRLGARYLWHGPPALLRLFGSALAGRWRRSRTGP
jgi:N-acetylglucosaminyldiphosphoundecaprenol N-acetyl-beta-D-mannosaminyltransferase